MTQRSEDFQPPGAWRRRLFDIIFHVDTPAGRAFDVALLVAIVASVVCVMLDSVAAVHARYGQALYVAEWVFTLLFTVEYALRLLVARSPRAYAFSFFGIVDLLSILPTYLSLIAPGTNYLLVIRVLRLLRVFRVLKLFRYMGEAGVLLQAVRASRRKVTVFLVTVLTLALVFGSVMYLVEGPERGFTSIPRSLYWALVTITTVGYGDISPHTPLGQAIAAVVMVLGYAIIAVPTGIYASELTQIVGEERALSLSRVCPACGARGHTPSARYCHQCGAELEELPSSA